MKMRLNQYFLRRVVEVQTVVIAVGGKGIFVKRGGFIIEEAIPERCVRRMGHKECLLH